MIEFCLCAPFWFISEGNKAIKLDDSRSDPFIETIDHVFCQRFPFLDRGEKRPTDCRGILFRSGRL